MKPLGVFSFFFVFICHYMEYGDLKEAILSLIHIAQGSAISNAFMQTVPNEIKQFWEWTTNVLIEIKDAFHFDNVYEDQILCIESIAITTYLLIMISGLIYSRQGQFLTYIMLVALIPIGVGI